MDESCWKIYNLVMMDRRATIIAWTVEDQPVSLSTGRPGRI